MKQKLIKFIAFIFYGIKVGSTVYWKVGGPLHNKEFKVLSIYSTFLMDSDLHFANLFEIGLELVNTKVDTDKEQMGINAVKLHEWD